MMKFSRWSGTIQWWRFVSLALERGFDWRFSSCWSRASGSSCNFFSLKLELAGRSNDESG